MSVESSTRSDGRKKMLLLLVVVMLISSVFYIYDDFTFTKLRKHEVEDSTSFYYSDTSELYTKKTTKRKSHLKEFIRLTNSCNNCFVNALMQLLYNIDLFRNFINESTSAEKNDLIDVLQTIFRIMKYRKSANLTKKYRLLVANLDPASDIKIDDMDCSLYLYECILSKLIQTELGLDDGGNIFESYNLISRIKKTKIGKMTMVWDIEGKYRLPYFGVAISPLNDEDIEVHINKLYNDKEIIDPLPKIILIQNVDLCGLTNPNNYTTLKEYININGIRFKFHGCAKCETLSGSLRHYYACVYKYNKFYTLDCLRGNKVQPPKFNVKLKDIFGVFYVIDEES